MAGANSNSALDELNSDEIILDPSSVQRPKVVQAFVSNRVEPIEANYIGRIEIKNKEEIGGEETQPTKNDFLSLQVDLNDKNQKILYGFLGIFGLLLGGIWASGYFLIPQRNIFEFDGFHYETFFYLVLMFVPMMNSKMVINAYYINGYRWENTFKVWAKTIVAGAIAYGVFFILLHFYQTQVRELCPPFPLHSTLAVLLDVWFVQIFLWFQYPAEVRKKKIFKKRFFRFATTYVPLMFVVFFVYNMFIPMGFALLPDNNYQWIMAIILPAFRELSVWFFTWYNSKHAEERDKKPIGDLILHDMATRHALALSIVATKQATTQTSFVILGIDFAINVFLAINIIRKKRQNPEENVDQDVQELMMAEKIEFVIPLLFYFTYIMGYHGPNGDLFGGIRVKIWEQQFPFDPDTVTYWLVIFFLIDLGSLVVSALLLWVFCRISCIPHYIKISVSYWLIMAIQETHWMNEVRFLAGMSLMKHIGIVFKAVSSPVMID